MKSVANIFSVMGALPFAAACFIGAFWGMNPVHLKAAEDAYATTREIVASAEPCQMQGRETTLYLRRAGKVWHLQVAILSRHSDPLINYADVVLHLTDDRGKEMPPRLMMPTAKSYIVSSTNALWGGTAFGDYLFDMGGKRRLATVEIIRGGEKHTFVFPKEN